MDAERPKAHSSTDRQEAKADAAKSRADAAAGREFAQSDVTKAKKKRRIDSPKPA